MPHAETTLSYSAPRLTVVGTVASLTQNDTAGPLSDAAIPNNTPPTLS